MQTTIFRTGLAGLSILMLGAGFAGAQPKPPERSQLNVEAIAKLLDKQDVRQAAIDAFRKRITQNWSPPVGGFNGEIVLRLHIGRNKLLSGNIEVVSAGDGPAWTSTRDSMIKAVFAAQPFDMLPDDDYATWKDIEIAFNTNTPK